MNTQTSPRHAFTLVELLVTIAVIALLAGLSFPLVQRTLHSSKQSAAISNLRQLGVLIQSYAADRGHYPPATDGIDWRGYWADSISPYANKDSWWGSDMPEVVDSPAKAIRTAAVWRAFIANPNVMPDMLWGSGQVLRSPRVRRPSETILLIDGVQNADGWVQSHIWDIWEIYDSNPNNADDLIPIQPNVDDGSARMRFPHQNRAHTLFADGHVALMANGELRKRHFVTHDY